MKVQRPVYVRIDDVVIDAADADEVELVLVADEEGFTCYLLQVDEAVVAVLLPCIEVGLHLAHRLHFLFLLNPRGTLAVFALNGAALATGAQ